MKDTIKRLLSSRKWLTALGAFVVSSGVLVAGWSEAVSSGVADQIVNVVLVLSGLYMGGTAIEDASEKIGALKK